MVPTLLPILTEETLFMKKRIALLALTAALLLSACSETTTAENTDGPSAPAAENAEVPETEPETEVDTQDHVPEMKFDKEMNFLLPDVSWLTRNIISDELTGERVNDVENLSLQLCTELTGMTALAGIPDGGRKR